MKKDLKSGGQEGISLVRVMSTDIPANKAVFAGLTRIKGLSWMTVAVACKKLGIDKSKKVSELTKEEIDKLNKLSESNLFPAFLSNRRFDRKTGEVTHLYGSNLDLVKEFDIKRLKKIRSYRGLRHATGQPSRGQRTRSHFRINKVVGVMKKGKKK